MTDLGWSSAGDIRARVVSGELSAEEVTRAFLDRITSGDAVRLGAFVRVDAEGALAQAREVDRRRIAGDSLGALAGVPVPLKDNLCVRGLPTTCGSRILEGWVSPYDAHVVERLRGAGAILVGKTSLDEFAMGSSTETSASGPARNPWNLERTPGGSSGGSAAAVAAGLAPVSLGSDTGGSVRQPASFCGVTALKPTYGRISRWGLVAFASSLDQIGPIGRTVRDTARVLGVLAGRDARDATSADRPVDDYESACGRDAKGLRVGVVRETLESGAQPEIVAAIENAITALRDLGCEVIEVDLPHAKHSVSVYYLVAPAEASSNLARFDGVRYGLRVEADDVATMYARTRARGFGPEVKRRIMLGTYALSAGYYDAFYLKAQKVRTLIRRDYDRALERCDAVLSPTYPTAAFALGERIDDPLSMYLGDVFTLPPSLAGLPAVSTPCGFTKDGLPIGVQLTAAPFAESVLVRIADAYQRATSWADRRPEGFG